MNFKINEARSQKYLNQKDLLFGMIGWYQFYTKVVVPLIISGVICNAASLGFLSLFIIYLLLLAASFIIDLVIDRRVFEFLVLKVVKPKKVVVKTHEIRGHIK